MNNILGEIDEANLAEHLERSISHDLKVIEKQTDHRTTIDSITTSVPSSTLNSPIVNQLEVNHLDQYRINRRF